MDFWDGFHIDDAYLEKDRFFEAKTNIKRKRILSYFGLPDSENDVNQLNVKDNALYFLDRNNITVHLFWSKEKDKYR